MEPSSFKNLCLARMGKISQDGPSRLFLKVRLGRDLPSQLFSKVGSGRDLPSQSRDEKNGISRDFIPTFPDFFVQFTRKVGIKVGINRGQSRFSPTFEPKIGKSRGYPDSPRLEAKNRGESGLASIYPELLRNFKKSGRPPRSRSRPNFGRDFIPLEISRT